MEDKIREEKYRNAFHHLKLLLESEAFMEYENAYMVFLKSKEWKEYKKYQDEIGMCYQIHMILCKGAEFNDHPEYLKTMYNLKNDLLGDNGD